jgi:hypothetical protein
MQQQRDLTVTQDGNGWDVLDPNGIVLASFPTNAAAWRWIDRHEGEPISRGEAVSEWIWSKECER